MRVTADWKLKLGLVDIGVSVFVVGVIRTSGAAVAGVGLQGSNPSTEIIQIQRCPGPHSESMPHKPESYSAASLKSVCSKEMSFEAFELLLHVSNQVCL